MVVVQRLVLDKHSIGNPSLVGMRRVQWFGAYPTVFNLLGSVLKETAYREIVRAAVSFRIR
jgi:hypothetical protein